VDTEDAAEIEKDLVVYHEHIEPLLKAGKTVDQIATEFYGGRLDYLKTVVDNAVGFEESPAGVFRRVSAEFQRLVLFPSEIHPKVCSLFVFASYLARPLLPAVFYVVLKGPASSGKTTVLEIMKELCDKGLLTYDASAPALARMLDRGSTLLADEIDQMEDERRDLVSGAARVGYRRGATYLRWDFKAKQPEEVKVFGAKAFSCHDDLDAALMTRTVVIKMERAPAEKVRELVLLNMVRNLSPVKAEIERTCADIVSRWNEERIGGRLLDPAFREVVYRLAGNSEMPRDVEIGAVLLLVAEMLGIDLVAELGHVLKDAESRGGANQEVVEIAEWLLERATSLGVRPDTPPGSKSPAQRTESLRAEWNAIRKNVGDRPISPRVFHRILSEVGLREGRDKEIRYPKNVSTIYFTPYLSGRLTSLGVEPPLTEATKPLTAFLSNPNQDETPNLTAVSNQEGVVRVLREKGIGLTASRVSSDPGGRGWFTLDELRDAARASGIDADEANKKVERWKKEGDIIEPRPGQFRFI
jgi:hypothetical protein